jgi:hypothetical protein
MKKSKIVFTVIKEASGEFSAIGQVGNRQQHLISAQGNSWDELKEMALAAANLHLKDQNKSLVTSDYIDYSFDLPSFFDAYPHVDTSQLTNQIGTDKTLLNRKSSGKKKVPDSKLHRILAAIKHVSS